MQFFLTTKRWTLFLLMVGPALLVELFSLSLDHLGVFGIAWATFVGVVVGWFYSVGLASNTKLPEEYQRSTTFFRIGLLFPFFYMALLLIFVLGPMRPQGPIVMPTWAIPLHIFTMIGLFHGLWFTAKQFTTLKRGQSVTFVEYAGPLFLFWFCFIGVWFLQPEINQKLGNDT